MKLDELKRGRLRPCDENTARDDLPDWLDMDKFKRGQEFFLRHIVIETLAMHFYLIIGFGLDYIVNALVHSGHSDTPGKSVTRYLDTFLHVFSWHAGDIWTNPDHDAFKSLRRVRKMHHKITKSLENERKRAKDTYTHLEGSSHANPEVFFNQYVMGITLMGFMGALTVYPSSYGLGKLTESELEAYIHFWRGIGHILGIEDEYNICRGNYEETIQICKEIEDNVLMEGLRNPPPHSEAMADAFCNGVNGLLRFPLLSKESVLAFVMGSMGRDFRLNSMTWPDWIRLVVYKLLVALLYWMPGFEKFLNYIAFRILGKVLKMSLRDRVIVLRKIAERIDREENLKKRRQV